MAGLGRKIFTAGDVLTASDVQNYLMDQTVMNFAGTAARSSAIATPTEGMVTYLADTNAVEVYDGAAYVSVGGSSGAIVPVIPTSVAVGSGTGSFNSTTGNVTFTGATSISVNGVFSSTYSRYIIVCSAAATTAEVVNLRFRTSGTDNSNSSYSTTIGRSTSNGTFAQVVTSEGGTSVSNFSATDAASANYQSITKVEVVNPFQSFVTNGILDGTIPNGITTIIQRRIGAFEFNATTSFDGFTIFSTASLTGTLKVMAYV